MAVEFTQIAHIIEPTHFVETVRERTAEKSRIVASGIVQTSPELDALADSGGSEIDLSFWADIPGDAEAETDDATAIETDRRVQGRMIARRFMHRKALAWMDTAVATALNQSDPAADLVERFATFWARQDQKLIVVPSLQGLFASDGPLGSGATDPHILDIAIEAGLSAADENLIGSDALIDAGSLLGDSWDSVAAVVMHSKVFARLQKMNLIEFESVSDQNIRIGRYQGKEIIVDDGSPVAAGGTNGFKYTSFLLGLGSFGMGVGTPPVPLEFEREALKSRTNVVTRRYRYIHPIGVSYTASPGVAGPTVGQLQTGTNWALSKEHKNVPIVALVTNG